MENKMCTVRVGETEKQYPAGTTYLQIAKDFQDQYKYDIVLVFVNQFKLQELHKKLKKDCVLQFVTTGDEIGNKTYRRSMSLMLVKAVHDIGGKEHVGRVRIHYSVSKGFYCTIEGDLVVNQEFLEKVEVRMHEIIEQKIPISKRSVHTDEAVKLFGKHGMHDKEHLFGYRRVSRVNIYSMSHYEDYYYGYMVPDTGYLRYFKLFLYDEGFVVQMPVKEHPDVVPDFNPQTKLFQVLKESTEWGDLQGLDTVSALNDMVTKHNMLETVLVQEAYQEQRIAEIAREINKHPDVKFVLIAGPSSSGKTTFSQRLAIELRVLGKHPCPVSVDNYFVNREDTPLDENGNYNFECLEAIDVEGFNRDMKRLLDGEEVILPTFD